MQRSTLLLKKQTVWPCLTQDRNESYAFEAQGLEVRNTTDSSFEEIHWLDKCPVHSSLGLAQHSLPFSRGELLSLKGRAVIRPRGAKAPVDTASAKISFTSWHFKGLLIGFRALPVSWGNPCALRMKAYPTMTGVDSDMPQGSGCRTYGLLLLGGQN